MSMKWDIIIIGGGPAGMMATGRVAEVAKEQGRKCQILLLEKNPSSAKSSSSPEEVVVMSPMRNMITELS